jgi:hypothetical protein
MRHSAERDDVVRDPVPPVRWTDQPTGTKVAIVALGTGAVLLALAVLVLLGVLLLAGIRRAWSL